MWRRNLMFTWIGQVLSLSGFQFAIPFIPFYIQELGVTAPADLQLWTGILASAPAVSMAIMAPIWGILADRLGKKMMILRAMVFGVAAMIALALAHTVTAVLVIRVFQGLFTGTVTAAAALIATGTPREKLGYALGLLSSSNFIGISIGPMLGGIASEYLGYRASFFIGAAILVVGFVLILVFVHEQKPVAEPANDRRSADDATAAPAESELAAEPVDRGWRNFLSATMIGTLAMLLLLRFARALPVPFLPLYVQELRGRLEGSASVTGLISAGRGAVTALAAVTLTRLGDRMPKMRVVTVLLALAAICSFPVAFIPSIAGFSTVFIVATFFLGGIEPLLQADMSTRVPANRRGLLFGVQTTVGNVGWFAAPLIGSAVGIGFGMNMVFLTLAIFLVITMVIAAFLSSRMSRDATGATPTT